MVNGLVVEEFIEDNGLVCINSGKGTRYNSANNTESVIDLTLAEVWGMIRKINGMKSKYEIPVLSSSYNKAIGNVEKAELLASTFVKIHGSDNLSADAKQSRENALMQQ